MNILVLWELNLEKIKSYLPQYNFTIHDDKKEIDYLFLRWANFKIDSIFLEKHPKLKWIYVFWIWLDNIDLKYCNIKNIKVTNAPTSSIQSVSELTLFFLLDSIRSCTVLNKKLLNWVYTRSPIWLELSSLSIWILWYWNIWKSTANILSLLWCNIRVFDIDSSKYDSKYIEEKTFPQFLSNIDTLLLHINFLPENQNLLWEKLLRQFPNIKRIINTSRKWIVNESELLKLLKEQHIFYYWTDVIHWEPDQKSINQELLSFTNCFVTPHIWANTIESQERIMNYIITQFKNDTK